jgi:hypothetical protein
VQLRMFDLRLREEAHVRYSLLPHPQESEGQILQESHLQRHSVLLMCRMMMIRKIYP